MAKGFAFKAGLSHIDPQQRCNEGIIQSYIKRLGNPNMFQPEVPTFQLTAQDSQQVVGTGGDGVADIDSHPQFLVAAFESHPR